MAESASRTVRVHNELGVHLRTASLIAQAAAEFTADIWLVHGETRADAKSIMSVLALGAATGAELQLLAEGCDATAAVDRLGALFDAGFPSG